MAPSLQACLRTLDELLELLHGDLEDLLQQVAPLSERCHALMLDCQALPAGSGGTNAEGLSLDRCAVEGLRVARYTCICTAVNVLGASMR